MSDQTQSGSGFRFKPLLMTAALGLAIAGAAIWPGPAWEMVQFVAMGLVSVAPLVLVGILLAAWIMASGADAPIARAFQGRMVPAIVLASLIGAITPVCGVTVLPLMAGLLGAGIPLAPIMAFWLSSPITDPAMLATTAAMLGFGFAAGKTMAAFGLGLWGGAITALVSAQPWVRVPLRHNALVGRLSQGNCGAPLPFDARIWKGAARRGIFRQNFAATTRLILICLIPAFAAGCLVGDPFRGLCRRAGLSGWLRGAAADPRPDGPRYGTRRGHGVPRFRRRRQHLGRHGDFSGSEAQTLPALSGARRHRLTCRRLCL